MATFIIANGALYYVLDENALEQEDSGIKAHYLQYRNTCKDNLLTALGNLNLFLSARRENIQALLLGVSQSGS